MDLSTKLGLDSRGLCVPYRFVPHLDGETLFAAKPWNMFMPEFFVAYSAERLRPYFENNQHSYPVGTDAPFSVPIGAVLLYKIAHEVTHALHWMCLLGEFPTSLMSQENVERYDNQYNHFFKKEESKPFVEGIAELGALMYLRNAHPIARRFATLHFTTRMIEAAHRTGRLLNEVSDDAADMVDYFAGDDEQSTVHDLTVRCFKHNPDWIVAPKRYEGDFNNPLYYAVGLLGVGQLVFSEGMKIAELMRMDLSKGSLLLKK